MKPWRDISSLQTWREWVAKYQTGGAASASKTAGRSVRSAFSFSSGTVLPKQITRLTTQIEAYHAIRKDDESLFTRRITALNAIAATVNEYLAKYKILAKPGRGFDGLVWSLGRRAQGKAGYLEELLNYYEADARTGKNLKDAGRLVAFLKDPSHQHGREMLRHVSMVPGVAMEGEDPFHRTFELAVEDGRIHLANMDAMSAVFYEWVKEVEANDRGARPVPPFFVWLEAHHICTGHKGTTGEGTADPADVHSVRYGSKQIPEMKLLHMTGGSIRATSLNSLLKDRASADLFHTYSSHKSKEDNASAYVWTVGGDLLAAPHDPGSLHHSSFASGKSVQCAGMVRANRGKIELISNDSGHYMPTTRHLYLLVFDLHTAGVFAPGAKVKYFGAAPLPSAPKPPAPPAPAPRSAGAGGAGTAVAKAPAPPRAPAPSGGPQVVTVEAFLAQYTPQYFMAGWN